MSITFTKTPPFAPVFSQCWKKTLLYFYNVYIYFSLHIFIVQSNKFFIFHLKLTSSNVIKVKCQKCTSRIIMITFNYFTFAWISFAVIWCHALNRIQSVILNHTMKKKKCTLNLWSVACHLKAGQNHLFLLHFVH